MTSVVRAFVLLSLLGPLAPVLRAQPTRPGQPAPPFTAVDSVGRSHTLADYAGRILVLEWYDPSCRFAKKHYGGSMQALQREWTSQGVVWLMVNSAGRGRAGHLSAEEANAHLKDKGAAPSALLLDEAGALASLFDAKTAPHVIIVGPTGHVIYNGAIDSRPTADVADIAVATNHVAAALAEAVAGKAITTSSTKPYGCGIRLPSRSPF